MLLPHAACRQTSSSFAQADPSPARDRSMHGSWRGERIVHVADLRQRRAYRAAIRRRARWSILAAAGPCCAWHCARTEALLGAFLRSTARKSARSPTSRSRCCRTSRRRRSSRWRTRGCSANLRDARDLRIARIPDRDQPTCCRSSVRSTFDLAAGAGYAGGKGGTALRGGDAVVFAIREGETFHAVANCGFPAEFDDFERGASLTPGRGDRVSARALLRTARLFTSTIMADGSG